ncbi:MAG: PHP domain-containing protein [Lachnospiraceae bacterium]
MNLTYDLHIHSCLSPCGDKDMTPANIVGLSALLGLDVIAITDHNTCRNCSAAMELAEEYDIICIPGMELTTSEEIHAVCLFPTPESAMRFDSYVYDHLMKIPNRTDIFGEQLVMDKDDNIVDSEPNLLINATDISFEGLWELVDSYGGVMFPAHIDKSSYSLISSLGVISETNRFTTAELSDLSHFHQLKKTNPYLNKCNIISNSDAHYLEHIHQPNLSIPCLERSIQGVLQALQ